MPSDMTFSERHPRPDTTAVDTAWRPRRIAMVFAHVASNIGDLAINRGQVLMLRRAFPEAELRAVYLNARQSAFLHEARASLDVDRPVPTTMFASSGFLALAYASDPARFLEDAGIADADLVVLSAGEHLFHYQHGENLRNLYWRSLPALAAKAAGKRCLLMPSTLGPFEDRDSVGLVRSLLDLVDAWAVRDARSGPLLRSTLGLEAEPPVLLDPAFFLEPPVRAAKSGQERVAALVMRSESWGIRKARAERTAPTAETVRDTDAYRFARAFSEAWLAAPERRLHIHVQTDADAVLAETLAADLAQPERVSVVRPLDIGDYLARLAEADVVVSSRFHAIILGLVAGTPGWGVYFDQHGHKMPGLFELLGTPERCQRLARGNAAEAGAAIAAAAGAATPGLGGLSGRLEALRDRTLAWLAAVEERPLGASQALVAMRAFGRYASDLAHESIRLTFTGKLEALETAVREARTQAVEQQRQAAEQQKQAQARIETLEAEVAKRDAQLAAEREAWESKLASERSEREGKLASLQHQLVQVRAKAARDVWAEREHWTSLLSYRAGDVLVHSLAKPWTLPLLPFRLFGAWRGYRADRAAREAELQSARADASAGVAKKPARMAVPHSRALAGLLATKVEPEIARTAVRLSGMGESAKSGAAAPASPPAPLPASGEASATQLKDAFFSALRSGDYRLACEAMVRIEALLVQSPHPEDRDFLIRLRRSSFFQVILLQRLDEAPEQRIEQPVRGRVCYVLHNSLPHSSGGYATRSHGVAGGLQAQGREVICITRPGFPVDIKPELDWSQVPLDESIDGVRYLRVSAPASKGITVPDYVSLSADELTRLFLELKPELVVAASNYRVGLMAMIAARRVGVPFIYEVRGWWELTRMSRDTEFMETSSFVAQSLLERAVANEAQHVFTLTEPMREGLIEHGAAEDRVTLLPNSCDPERFVPIPRDGALAAKLGIPDGVPVIGYVGTFVDYEGLEDLADACGLLARRGLDFRLLLVGNENTSGTDRGPITSAIMEAAAAWSDRLIMPGRVPHEEVERYYSLIDIAPFPRKPWPVCEMVSPMKPLEALAMEKAVVASDVRALAEMIQDQRTGLLFRKGDVSSLADVLAQLMADPELRRNLGREGRAWVAAQRTWRAVGANAATIMDGVLRRHG